MLKDNYYLLHFWSMTCAPCIAELKELHQLFQDYKEANFTIVSFSMGDSQVKLKQFWEDKWSMPWYNVLLSNGWQHELAKSFEVRSIPNIMIVGPSGKILENFDTLQSTKLSDALNNYLNTSK